MVDGGVAVGLHAPRDADGTRVVAAVRRAASERVPAFVPALGPLEVGGQRWNQATLNSFGEVIPRSFVFGPQTAATNLSFTATVTAFGAAGLNSLTLTLT